MDAAAFEQVYGAFQDFHAYFAPLFGRRRRGSTAVIISRLCWYSLGSGATPRICRRRFRHQPGGFSEKPLNPPG